MASVELSAEYYSVVVAAIEAVPGLPAYERGRAISAFGVGGSVSIVGEADWRYEVINGARVFLLLEFIRTLPAGSRPGYVSRCFVYCVSRMVFGTDVLPCSRSDIAAALRVHVNNVTRAMAVLERLGVVRRDYPAGSREVVYRLNPHLAFEGPTHVRQARAAHWAVPDVCVAPSAVSVEARVRARRSPSSVRYRVAA